MPHDLCVQLVPLFQDLSGEDQLNIQRSTRFRTFHKGDIVFSQHSDPQLSIVARGSMKVYRVASNGREQLLRVIEPGGYEGESQLFGASNQNLYGQALTDTMVCVLLRRDFMRLLDAHPQLSVQLLSTIAGKMAKVEEQAQFLTMGRVEERLASYLLDLSKSAGGSQRVRIPMTMKELASFLGTTPETLSRKFRYLEDRRIIARQRRDVVILSSRQLEEM